GRTWPTLSRVVRARSLYPALAGARQKRGIENILRSEFGLKAMGKTELSNGLIETGHVDGAIAERRHLGSSDVLLGGELQAFALHFAVERKIGRASCRE